MLIVLFTITVCLFLGRLIFLYTLRLDLSFKITLKESLKFHKINLRNSKLIPEISVKYYFSLLLSIIFGVLLAFVYQNISTLYLETLEFLLFSLFILASAVILLYLSIFDIIYFEIPLRVIYIFLSVAMFMNILFVILRMFGISTLFLGNITNLLGGILLGGIFYFVVKITKDKGMGMGDVYLMIGIGLSLGVSSGLISYLVTLLLASAFGITYGIVKKNFRGVIIPLVPFISLGFLIALALNNSFMSNLFFF